MARQALEAGADILVAQGTEAGGHGASRTTIDIVPAIVDLAAGRVPVAAAGGIGDGRGLAAMMMLGASGVLLGTRFYASEEADGAEEAKRRICAARSGSTVRGIIFDLSRNNVWPAPFTGRCLINDHARRWIGREVELLQNVNAVAAEYALAKAAGNFDVAAVIAGEAVGLIHDVPPAAEIVDRIVTEAVQILRGRSSNSAVAPDEGLCPRTQTPHPASMLPHRSHPLHKGRGFSSANDLREREQPCGRTVELSISSRLNSRSCWRRWRAQWTPNS